MSILEKINQHLTSRADPKVVAAKEAAQGEAARALYAALEGMGGKIVVLDGKRAKLNVTLGSNAVHVAIDLLERKIIKTPKGHDQRWKDTGECIDGWSAWHNGRHYVLKRAGGPELEFAEQADLETDLAKQVAQIWEA